jgi:heme exporter protein A
MPDHSESNPAIKAERLFKSFGHITALRGVDFSIARGETATLFGPNGAGKTTLIRILAGLVHPTSGKAFIDGCDMSNEEPEPRKKIGVISHQTYLYNNLTTLENLRFYGRMYGVKPLEERITKAIEEVGLADRRNDLVRTFSRGMQQRLSIARATLHSPSILFLDEPYTGLDQHAARNLRKILEHLHTEGRTVVMVTHNIARGLEMCDRVFIQVKGRMVFDKPIQEVPKEGFEELYFGIVDEASK